MLTRSWRPLPGRLGQVLERCPKALGARSWCTEKRIKKKQHYRNQKSRRPARIVRTLGWWVEMEVFFWGTERLEGEWFRPLSKSECVPISCIFKLRWIGHNWLWIDREDRSSQSPTSARLPRHKIEEEAFHSERESPSKGNVEAIASDYEDSQGAPNIQPHPKPHWYAFRLSFIQIWICRQWWHMQKWAIYGRN